MTLGSRSYSLKTSALDNCVSKSRRQGNPLLKSTCTACTIHWFWNQHPLPSDSESQESETKLRQWGTAHLWLYYQREGKESERAKGLPNIKDRVNVDTCYLLLFLACELFLLIHLLLQPFKEVKNSICLRASLMGWNITQFPLPLRNKKCSL